MVCMLNLVVHVQSSLYLKTFVTKVTLIGLLGMFVYFVLLQNLLRWKGFQTLITGEVGWFMCSMDDLIMHLSSDELKG